MRVFTMSMFLSDNTLPFINGPSIIHVMNDVETRFQFNITDLDGDDVNVTYEDMPPNAFISYVADDTWEFVWTPNHTHYTGQIR